MYAFDTLNVYVFDTLYFNDTTFYSVQDTLSFSINSASTGSPVNVNIKVYPNPATTKIVIDVSQYTSLNNYLVRVFNSLGSVVHTSSINSSIEEIDVSSIGGAGSYYLEIYDSSLLLKARKAIIIQ